MLLGSQKGKKDCINVALTHCV